MLSNWRAVDSFKLYKETRYFSMITGEYPYKFYLYIYIHPCTVFTFKMGNNKCFSINCGKFTSLDSIQN